MSKNDSQGKNRGARRRPNGKSFISRFQWDSVDDQAQEDLIVPTSSPAPSSSKRRGGNAKPPRRREKEVGTMYVSPSDDFYGAPKKKARPEPRLEDYADFVADVEDGELDAFATPSYGRTRLTRDDEALVEELATKKEKVRQKRAPKVVADDEAQEREAVEREARKAARRDEREKREKREKCEKPEKKEKSEKAGKRSFLSKIKEAITTGSVSSDADERSARRETSEDAAIPSKKMRWLKQKATKFLEENGRALELDEAASQAEELAALLEAMIKATTGGSAPREGGAGEERFAKTSERRPTRTLEEIFGDAPTSGADADDVEREERKARKEARAEKTRRAEKTERTEAPERSEKSERASREEKAERRTRRDEEAREEPKPAKRKSAAPVWDDFDDDYDPIAVWERIAADE
ncbi:MAG: hypothetical protein IJO46_12355, partial [Thermoguttaceae bacterium]|nr:hypothetical protein [Thermoguttaceae bacterium]